MYMYVVCMVWYWYVPRTLYAYHIAVPYTYMHAIGVHYVHVHINKSNSIFDLCNDAVIPRSNVDE